MSEPPETDLDYYSRPENYTGSSLRSLQKFTFAKQKQDKALTEQHKKTKKKKNGFDLFARYKHILKGYVSDEDEKEDENEWTEDTREDSPEKLKFEDIKEDNEDTKEKYEGKTDNQEKVDQTVLYTEENSPNSWTESCGHVVDATSPVSHASPRESITSTSPVPPRPRGQSDVPAVRSSISLRFAKQQQINNELRSRTVSVQMYQI